MKRNNLFFLSYIIFIFVCATVRIFWDFPLWSAIVAAITTASCIFAVADIAGVVAIEYANDVGTYMPLLESALKTCEELEKIIIIHRAEVLQNKINDSKAVDIIMDGSKILGDTKQQLTCIIKGVKSKEKTAERCKWIESPLIVCGHLAFFCIISFAILNDFFASIQDYLTVFAFGMIMVTQYFSNHVKEEHIELEENYKKTNMLLKDVRQSFQKYSAHLHEEIKNYAN